MQSTDRKQRKPKRHHRAIFISDVHLGTRGCQAETLLDFLKHNTADQIYLIGDIVDCWQLKRSWYWPQAHNEVIRRLLKMARAGTRVIYVPGNHDEVFRDYCGTHFGGIEVALEAIHETADGKRMLVLHGDAFDGVVNYARWLAVLGDQAYIFLLKVNRLFNVICRRLGFRYWSLSAYLKLKVKNAIQFIDNYERAVSSEARRRGVEGVICGHIHHAEIRSFGDILYINDGDWVESCTAIVEQPDGTFRTIRWVQERDLLLTSRTREKSEKTRTAKAA